MDLESSISSDYRAYVKASELYPAPGSAHSTSAASTRSANSSSAHSVKSASSGCSKGARCAEDVPYRTPISAQARPFIPSSSRSSYYEACRLAQRWGPSAFAGTAVASSAPPVSFAIMGCSSPAACTASVQPAYEYSEEVQEHVYLNSAASYDYCEQLQEDVYLNAAVAEESVFVTKSRASPVPSRTPSPPARVGVHPDVTSVAQASALLRWLRPESDRRAEADECPSCKDDTVRDGGLASVQALTEESHSDLSTEVRKCTSWACEKGDEVPVRHTFIHYNVPDSLVVTDYKRPLPRSSSAPALLTNIAYCVSAEDDQKTLEGSASLQVADTTIRSCHNRQRDSTHKLGDCKPCAYYFHKEDGCRMGSSCTFCHQCPPGELKKRKKEKAKYMREQARLARSGGDTPPMATPELTKLKA